MRLLRQAVPLAALLLIVAVTPVAAQDPPTAPDPKTPTPPPAPAKASEAQLPAPPMPEKMRTLREKAENSSLVKRLRGGDDGVYPRAFSIWTGAGVSAGVGYRQHTLADRALFNVSGEWSIRDYRVVETSLEWPALPHHLYVRGDARYRHFPQEDFFGIGGNSRQPLRSTYRLDTNELWTTMGRRVNGMTTGVEFGWMGVDVDRGTDARYPGIDQLFVEATAPGLTEQPAYIRTGVFWDLDRLDEPGYPRRGAHARVTFNDYRDVRFTRYNFKRFEAEATGYRPVAHDRDTIAVRARVTYANNAPGHVVPFYMLPTIGGGNSLRAFDEFRYRDENALLLNAEYRIGVHELLDVALFSDAGKVAHDYQGINPKGLIADYGAGARFHTATRTIFRFDVAHGREGTKYLFKMTRAF